MTLPENVDDILPLSPVQSGMLFHSIGDGAGPGAYVAVVTATLNGPLDAERLRRAISEAVHARDVLRASFVYSGIKTPVQVIHREVAIPWAKVDWSGLAPDSVECARSGLIEAERLSGFDFTVAPIMRVTLARLAEDRHLLIWTIHHILSDGWSTSILLQDVLRHYEGDVGETQRAPSFRDYLGWLKRRDATAGQRFWSKHLADFSEPTRIAAAPLARQQADLHRIRGREISLAETEALYALAQRLRVTQGSLLAALWALVLRRYSHSSDVTLGLTTSGRPVDLPQIDQAVGSFVNTLPIRVIADAEASFERVVKDVDATLRARAPHEFDALTDVRDWAGVAPGQQLFDALFVHQSLPALATGGGVLQIGEIDVIGPSNYAIAMVTTPGDVLRFDIYYDPSQNSASLIDALLSDMCEMAHNAVRSPNVAVKSLLVKDGASAPTRAEADPQPSVIEAFFEVASNTPDAPAVSDSDTTLSYAELRAQVLRIAAALKEAGIGARDIVPVAVERSVGAVAACLGVMASGAAYVTLDVEYPEASVRKILNATQPKSIVTTRHALAGLPNGDWEPICLDALAADAPVVDISPPASSSPAYVLFTSGSQGIPKGVVISHRALAHSTGVRDAVYGGPPEAFLLLSSFAFDSSVVGLYWTLSAGGHLVVAPRRAERDPSGLGALLEEHGVTHTLCLPGLHDALLSAVAPAQLASLNTVIVAGEAVAPDLVRKHRQTLPDCRLFNEYGPTEATVWATACDLTSWSSDGPIPIGEAILGVEVTVRDADGVPLPNGVTGEIAISGPTLADGYLNDKTRTAESFPEWPNRDGTLQRVYRTGDLGVETENGLLFAGRVDQQVKIRGHRIETGEIETLARQTLGGTSSVALKTERHGTAQLVLCIEDAKNAADEAALTRACEENLPTHARPSSIVWHDAFPRLPNGKIDRAALARQVAESTVPCSKSRPPEPGTEARLARIWADILKVDDVPRDANFFDLGGDSLKTITLYSEAEKQGFVLSPNDIFEHPTLAGLAARVTAAAQSRVAHVDGRDVRMVHADGTETPVAMLHGNLHVYNHLVRGFGENRPVGLKFSNHFEGNSLPLGATIESMAAEALVDFEPLLQGRGCVLVGYSAGAAIVMEMAKQLKARGTDTVFLCLVDPPLSIREPLAVLRSPGHGVKQLARAAFELGRVALGSLVYNVTGAREKRRLLQVNRATALAMNRYAPTPHKGPMLILTTLEMARAPDLFPGAEVEHVDFGHLDLLADRDVAHSVAARLIERIRGL